MQPHPEDSPLATELAPVRALVRQGRYWEALRLVKSREFRESPGGREESLVLLAELLQRTGEAQRAAEVAQNLLTEPASRPTTRARAQVVLGSVCRDSGDLNAAIQNLDKAVTLAHDVGDLQTACWARLRQMLAVAEASGPDAAVGLLGDARRMVNRAGDRHITAALHVFVAEIETKRGLFDSVKKHIRTCDDLLQFEGNAWLQGLSAIADLCISFLGSDLEQALKDARTALRLSRLSGHAASRMAATSNLGHIYLALGNFQKAEEWLERALLNWPQGGGGRIAILDGLAQIALMSSDLSKSGEDPRSCRSSDRRQPREAIGTTSYARFRRVRSC